MSEEFREVVRLLGTNLDGTKKVAYALKGIKGVGINLAHVVVRVAGIDESKRLGQLSDAELKKIEDVLLNPLSYGIPHWMLNRQKDPKTGKHLHLLGPDLDLAVRQDIELMKEIGSWKGLRHSLGLKVRGQKTRTTGRKGRTVGVVRRRKK